jgi:predicted nicotinamide N-methyase
VSTIKLPAGAEDAAAFIRANTAIEAPRLVPEIRLHLASEITPIWEATEKALDAANIDPPFWAFAWAGGQALARYLLDNPATVAGKSVLDFGAGSGIEAIAAALAGAASVLAADIDPVAGAAVELNAALNGVTVATTARDVIGEWGGWDVVLAGDVCYERPMAERVTKWLSGCARAGAEVLVGDPGRTYFPRQGLEQIAGYAVRTTREIEDTDLRNACVWRVVS